MVLVIVSFLLAEKSFAQEPSPSPMPTPAFDYERAYQDYNYTFNLYTQAHTEYVASKEAYLSYQTLSAKADAQDKTLKMLQLRDEVARTYLTAIRMRLAEATGITNYEQNSLYLKLDDEVAWYANHREKLTSAGSLEDLTATGNEFVGEYKTTEVLTYQALGMVVIGKEKSLRLRLKDQISAVRSKVASLRNGTNNDKANKVERWLLEAENKIARSEEKENSFLASLNKLRLENNNKTQTYYSQEFTLEDANQYLKESNSDIKESLRELAAYD